MGLFIVFEGVEGSGKSTQSRELHRRLCEKGIDSTHVREPGGTPTAEYVREWLINGPDMSPLTELLLFSAARSSLVESVIKPALDKDRVVVCDRYIYSTLAYQGYGRSMDMSSIESLNEIATGGLLPDVVVLLDVPPATGLERKQGGDPDDRFEREDAEFHQRIYQGYRALAAREPDRWMVMDGRSPKDRLSEDIWTRVLQLLNNKD